ncbi:MAG: hypothetical protein QOI23_2448 [Chloroflexota bacterium]|jgi:hypothetical protein|nr:hypothetical protein [Chloroflexota bacterium]
MEGGDGGGGGGGAEGGGGASQPGGSLIGLVVSRRPRRGGWGYLNAAILVP